MTRHRRVFFPTLPATAPSIYYYSPRDQRQTATALFAMHKHPTLPLLDWGAPTLERTSGRAYASSRTACQQMADSKGARLAIEPCFRTCI